MPRQWQRTARPRPRPLPGPATGETPWTLLPWVEMIIGTMSQPSSTALSQRSDNAPAPTPSNTPAGAVRLHDWGVIRARGEEAGAFLQSQLTNDLAGVTAERAQLAGYCSAK